MADSDDKVPANVQALLNERDNAEAYGQTDRVAKIDRVLAGLGVKAKAAAKRRAAADDAGTARSEPPQNRRGRPHEVSDGDAGNAGEGTK